MSKQVVVIEREKWLHGEGSMESALLRSSDEKMCCLGFTALACGADREAIKGCLAVAGLIRRDAKVPEQLMWLVDNNHNSPMAYRVMVVNDCELGSNKAAEYGIYSEADREAYIAKRMGENGIEVQFV